MFYFILKDLYVSSVIGKRLLTVFLFIEGKITTFNTFQIDGYLQKDFFDLLLSRTIPFGGMCAPSVCNDQRQTYFANFKIVCHWR